MAYLIVFNKQKGSLAIMIKVRNTFSTHVRCTGNRGILAWGEGQLGEVSLGEVPTKFEKIRPSKG